MNKYVKKGLCLVLATGLIASSFAGCAKVNYVTNGAIKAIHQIKDGSWQNQTNGEEAGSSDDTSVLEKSFEAGTYGGVDFKSLEDVANYYKEAYDYTKSLTAEYTNQEGKTETFYKLLGNEDINVGSVMIDGKENAVINKLVPGIVGGLFKPNIYGLVPCNNRNPKLDNSNTDEANPGEKDFRKSYVTKDDVLDANITDNGDGTITMVIQPMAAEMSMRGEDSQGNFFEVLGDISGTVAQISVISFAQGTAEDNIKVTYKGGTVTCTIDTKTKEITKAEYNMVAEVAVNHATVTVIKDKSASLSISYKNTFPASDKYLKETKGVVRK